MLYAMLCIYISLYYIRPFEWMEGLKGSPVFLAVGLFSVLVLLHEWFSGRIAPFRNRSDNFVFWFAVAIAFSHLSHGYLGGVINFSATVLPTFVGYFLVAHGIDSFAKSRFFFLLLAALTTFLAYQGYLQFAQGSCLGGLPPVYEYGVIDGETAMISRIRWFGMFNDPNDFALLFVILVPLLVDSVHQRRFLIPAICLPPVLYALYLTNSRGAMVALAASITAYFVLYYRSKKGALIGSVLAAVISIVGPSRMADISAGGDSARGRLEAWREGLVMFKDNPLFGVGAGSFLDYHDLTAHNSFLLVLAELGIFGSIFYLGLFYEQFYWAANHLLDEEQVARFGVLSRGEICAWYGSLVGTVVAIFFLSRSYILIPFLVVGVISNATGKMDAPDFAPSQSTAAPVYHKSRLLVLVLAEIIFFFLIVKLCM